MFLVRTHSQVINSRDGRFGKILNDTVQELSTFKLIVKPSITVLLSSNYLRKSIHCSLDWIAVDSFYFIKGLCYHFSSPVI